MPKTGSRRFIRVCHEDHWYEITVPQWRAFDLLSPQWMWIKWKVIHFNTRLGLERQGWAEFRNVSGTLQVRLTPLGLIIRDKVELRLAQRRDRELRR